MFLNVFIRFCKFGKVRKTEETLADFPEKKKSKCWKRKEKEMFLALRFRIIFKRYVKNCKGVRSTDFKFMVLRKSFYIRWSAGRSPLVHEVNPGRDPSTLVSSKTLKIILS